MPYVPAVPNSATGGFLTPTATTLVEDDDFDNILQGLVVGITGLPSYLVRPRWQIVPPASPSATTNWCAIGVMEETFEPYEQSMHYSITPSEASPPDPTGDGYTESWENVRVQVLVSFYGPNARGYGAAFIRGLKTPQNREYLYQYHAQIVSAPKTLMVMSEFDNEQWIQRRDCTLIINVRIASIWTIQNLLQAQATINTDDGGQETVITPP